MLTHTKQVDWNDMNCFALDVSMWSGRSKMTRDDLKDPDAVPPDALASLGSLKLIDPDRLKIFNALKRRALRMLESHGVGFLNGFVVSEDMIDVVDAELVKIRDEYNMNIVKLMSDYAGQCDDWLQANSQWAHIIRPRLPSAADIQRKFNFDWTLFKIQPASSRTAHHGSCALEDAKDRLGDTAVVEVSKMLGECARNLLRDGREAYNSNSFSAVEKAIKKCNELAFINPELGVLSAIINNVRVGVLSGSLSNDMFRVIFAALSSPSSIQSVLELGKAGVSVEDMGWALQPSVQSKAEQDVSEAQDIGDAGMTVPPVPIPMVDSTEFAEPVVDTTPVEVFDLNDSDDDDMPSAPVYGVDYHDADDPIERAIDNATQFKSAEPWKATVQEIIRDMPLPSSPVCDTHKQDDDMPVPEIPAQFTGLMNLDGII